MGTKSNGEIAVMELINWITVNISCLSSDDRQVRKNFLIDFQQKLDDFTYGEDDYKKIFSESYQQLINELQDPVERCRELSALICNILVQKQSSLDDDFLTLLFSTLAVKIGQSEDRESSEEVRLVETNILSNVIKLLEVNLKYMNDVVFILSGCIIDSYPEIKHCSCKCVHDVALRFRKHFHMCSHTLVPPLLKTISHQHSKIRVACIKALGVVIQNGDNSGVKDVFGHLAQRMFDTTPSVRLAVAAVLGMWLVELPDRYSYFPQLLSLMLSALSDEVDEVRNESLKLWVKAGEVYLEENEKNYKDQLDFSEPDVENYPDLRPTFGCRALVQRYYSAVLPALQRDIGDWLPETRIKAAQVLYKLVLHCENKSTMKLQMLLDIIIYAAKDEEKKVAEVALKTAGLIGYFVNSDLWSSCFLKLLPEKPDSSCLGVLAAVIQGFNREWNKDSFDVICETLAHPNICRLQKLKEQANLLLCIEALLLSDVTVNAKTSYNLFTALISVAGLSTSNLLLEKCNEILDLLCSAQSKNSLSSLYEAHTIELLSDLVIDHEFWITINPEASIFIYLMQECCKLDQVVTFGIPIIVNNLKPQKDLKLKSLFLSLVKCILENASFTEGSGASSHIYQLIENGILPNLKWSPGKAMAALRAIAIANLWEVIRTSKFNEKMLQDIADDLLPVLKSLTDDEQGITRLLACKVLEKSLPAMVKSTDDRKIHDTIQEFIHCLDDEVDDGRIAATDVFRAYLKSFGQNYDWVSYKQHLQRLIKYIMLWSNVDIDFKLHAYI